jgi:hypothetical protein
MKKLSLFIIVTSLLLSPLFMNIIAQVTIGSSVQPDNNSLLDLKEDGTTLKSTKGLLMPRVYLSNLVSPSPLVEHVEGIIVYNLQETDILHPGLYKNDGTRWIPMQLPNDGLEGQVLEIDPVTLAPKWVTKYIPPTEETNAYSLTKAEAIKDVSGASLTTSYGGTEYAENTLLTSTGWTTIIDPIYIPVDVADNKIIIFLQTTLIQPGYTSGGSVSYAGGVFLDGRLKGVRMGVITSTSDGTQPVSKMETLFFVLENLEIGTQKIDIAFKRRTSTPSNGVPALHIGQTMGSVPGSTSVSYEFYEKNSTF